MTDIELIKKAASVINYRKLESESEAGNIGCALETEQGNVFTGVCIDLPAMLGMCAEQAAIAEMIKAGEEKISKIVAVWKDDKGGIFVVSPCGACRQFMKHVSKDNLNAEVLISETETKTLSELLPLNDSWQPVKID